MMETLIAIVAICGLLCVVGIMVVLLYLAYDPIGFLDTISRIWGDE